LTNFARGKLRQGYSKGDIAKALSEAGITDEKIGSILEKL